MIRSPRSKAHRVRAAMAAFAFAAALPVLSTVQENLGRGRISGQVTDESGAPIEGAKVVAVISQGGARLEGVTDKRGHFAIAGLGSGAWRITASKDGYVEGVMDMEVAQLRTNPPVSLKMKKLSGVQGLRSDKAAADLIDKANALLGRGDYDQALELLGEFQAKYPDIYQVRLSVATAYMKKGQDDKAEAEFMAVLEKIRQVSGDYAKDRAMSVPALVGLGELAVKKGDMAAGEEYFRQSLAISPKDAPAAYNVGEILFSNQKLDEAARYFEMAIQINPAWPRPYHKLGLLYLNKGDYAKALENLNKFTTLDPANPEVPTVKSIIATIEEMKK